MPARRAISNSLLMRTACFSLPYLSFSVCSPDLDLIQAVTASGGHELMSVRSSVIWIVRLSLPTYQSLYTIQIDKECHAQSNLLLSDIDSIWNILRD